MDDRISMSISTDSPSDETLDRGPLALLLRWQYEFLFGINIEQISIFNFLFFNISKVEENHMKKSCECFFITIDYFLICQSQNILAIC